MNRAPGVTSQLLWNPVRARRLWMLKDDDELPHLQPWEDEDEWEAFDPERVRGDDWDIDSGLELEEEAEPEPGDFWHELEEEDW